MPATPINAAFASDERNNFDGLPNLGSITPAGGVDRVAVLAIAAEFGDPTLTVDAVSWGGRAFQRLGGIKSAAQNTLLDYWVLREVDYPSATGFLFATLSAAPNNNCCLVLGEGQGANQGAILNAVTALVADGAPTALFSETTSAGDMVFHAAVSSEGTDLAGSPTPDAFGGRLRNNDFTLEMSAWGDLPAGTADYGHTRVGGEAFSNGLQALVKIPAAGGGGSTVAVTPDPIGSGVGVGAPVADRVFAFAPRPIGSGVAMGRMVLNPKAPTQPAHMGSGVGVGQPGANRVIRFEPGHIDSGVGLGQPAANRIIRFAPVSIGTGVRVASPEIRRLRRMSPGGIGSGVGVGVPRMNFAAKAVDPAAIGSGAGTGQPAANRVILFEPRPVGSGADVGAPNLRRITRIAPRPIGSGASVGRPVAMALKAVAPVGVGAGAGLAAPDAVAIWAAEVAGSAGGVFTFRENDHNTFDDNGAFNDLAPGATRDTTAPVTASDSVGSTASATVTVTVAGIEQPGNPWDDAASIFDPSLGGVTVDGSGNVQSVQMLGSEPLELVAAGSGAEIAQGSGGEIVITGKHLRYDAPSPRALAGGYTAFIVAAPQSFRRAYAFSLNEGAERQSAFFTWTNGVIYLDAGGLAAPNRISGPWGGTLGLPSLFTFVNDVAGGRQVIRRNGTVIVSDDSGHAATNGLLAIGLPSNDPDDTAYYFGAFYVSTDANVSPTDAADEAAVEAALIARFGLT